MKMVILRFDRPGGPEVMDYGRTAVVIRYRSKETQIGRTADARSLTSYRREEDGRPSFLRGGSGRRGCLFRRASPGVVRDHSGVDSDSDSGCHLYASTRGRRLSASVRNRRSGSDSFGERVSVGRIDRAFSPRLVRHPTLGLRPRLVWVGPLARKKSCLS